MTNDGAARSNRIVVARRTLGGLVLTAAASGAWAQSGTTDATPGDKDIVVTGQRVAGSAIGDVEPIAVLGQDALRSLAATNFKTLLDRLKPLTTSASGADPIVLLNGRRISGMGEAQSLPPEAIERTEVLPESEAARFGFAPTVRVLNLITKKHFRATTVMDFAGTTTEGGGGTNYAEVNATRIEGPRRASLSISHLRLNPISQGERDIVPDPDALYAIGGTVTGVDGASIDPALDALAGRPVTVAAVPTDPALRRMLGAYAASANVGAVSDIGRYRTIQQRSDVIRVDGTIASPIGKSLDGSLNLAITAQRDTGLNGLAPAVLRVPGGGGALPFANDVLLYRYLPDAVLRQRNTNLDLHAAGTLQGGIRRWSWNVSTSYDRVEGKARSEQGVPIAALQAAIDAGGDPLAPIDRATAARRIADRSETVTGTLVSKAVANGPALRLPAGDARMTVSLDYARSSASGRQPGIADSALDLSRIVTAGSVNADIPIASPDALAFMGRLAVNGMIGVSGVSDYGRLASSSYGLNWTPTRIVQITAAVDDARTPPAIALLTNPVVTTPNTPFFDFTTGTSVLVTTIAGGNPVLAPERRRTTTLGISVKPIRRKELRVNVDYIDTRIGNQTTTLGGATPAFQAAFPTAFARDPAGQLVGVDLRPVNVARERERKMRMTFNLSTPIGRAPPVTPPPAGVAAADLPPPKPPKPRPTISATIATTWRLEDRLVLRDDLPAFDLLDGATLTGVGGRPRWETEIDLRGSVGALSGGLYGRLQGPTRIRGDVATSDLRFSGRTWLVPYAALDLERVVRRPWAKAMTVHAVIENLLNDRIDVRDRNGATPNRFQRAYIDPYGRSVRLGVRKAF